MMKTTKVGIEEYVSAIEIWDQHKEAVVVTSTQYSLISTQQNNKTTQRNQSGQLNDSKIYLHMT